MYSTSDNKDHYTNELTMTMLRSDEFIIYTKEIAGLERSIMEIVMLGNCGACVVSRPRCGKTTSMIYISHSLKEHYGGNFPIVMWDITDHAVTEKNFYSSLLTALKIPHSAHATALDLKNRVLSELVTLACDTIFKKVVLMIDEAWRLNEKDFIWLMDLYNILRRHSLQLITIFFSTNELLDLKKKFKAEGLDQIVERFFLNIYQFHGVRDQGELMICMHAFDQMNVATLENNKPISLKDFYFPRADEDAHFYNLTTDFWNAFTNIRVTHGMTVDDIPMEFVVGSFRILLGCYGKLSNNSVVWPDYKVIHECIIRSGYTESDDERLDNNRAKRVR